MNILKLLLCLLILSTSCSPDPAKSTTQSGEGLIKISIMYANATGNTFDMDYYASKHMPMLAETFGEAMMKYEIDSGISGRTADETAPYIAIGHLYFYRLSDYENLFGQHRKKILGDIPNYTNLTPSIQISRVIN